MCEMRLAKTWQMQAQFRQQRKAVFLQLAVPSEFSIFAGRPLDRNGQARKRAAAQVVGREELVSPNWDGLVLRSAHDSAPLLSPVPIPAPLLLYLFHLRPLAQLLRARP